MDLLTIWSSSSRRTVPFSFDFGVGSPRFHFSHESKNCLASSWTFHKIDMRRYLHIAGSRASSLSSSASLSFTTMRRWGQSLPTITPAQHM
jgi:hypothetical protein